MDTVIYISIRINPHKINVFHSLITIANNIPSRRCLLSRCLLYRHRHHLHLHRHRHRHINPTAVTAAMGIQKPPILYNNASMKSCRRVYRRRTRTRTMIRGVGTTIVHRGNGNGIVGDAVHQRLPVLERVPDGDQVLNSDNSLVYLHNLVYLRKILIQSINGKEMKGGGAKKENYRSLVVKLFNFI
jgi:hypothetical protein